MTESSAIRIEARVETDAKGKKRLNIYINPELADLISKLARLDGVSQGEIVEVALKESLASSPMGAGKWRIGKR